MPVYVTLYGQGGYWVPAAPGMRRASQPTDSDGRKRTDGTPWNVTSTYGAPAPAEVAVTGHTASAVRLSAGCSNVAVALPSAFVVPGKPAIRHPPDGTWSVTDLPLSACPCPSSTCAVSALLAVPLLLVGTGLGVARNATEPTAAPPCGVTAWDGAEAGPVPSARVAKPPGGSTPPWPVARDRMRAFRARRITLPSSSRRVRAVGGRSGMAPHAARGIVVGGAVRAMAGQWPLRAGERRAKAWGKGHWRPAPSDGQPPPRHRWALDPYQGRRKR